MSERTLQELVDAFNEDYLKACESAEPKDWMNAALAGRHLMNGIVEDENMGLIDILPELQKQLANPTD